MLAMELENIEREKIDGSLAKRQIRQYFHHYKVFLLYHFWGRALQYTEI